MLGMVPLCEEEEFVRWLISVFIEAIQKSNEPFQPTTLAIFPAVFDRTLATNQESYGR